jgi:membrane-associated phospholipid phosphatase
MNELANIISLTVLSSYIIPSLMYLGTSNGWFMKLLGGLFATNIGIELVKPLFGSRGWLGRPAGATDCDAFCGGGSVGDRPGFPSGHMANVTMLVSALWLRLQSPAVLVVGVPWIAAMAWARWRKRCHNWQQIVAGTVVGLVCGYIAH